MIKACLPTTHVSAWLSISSVVSLLAVNPRDFICRMSCGLMFTFLTDIDDRFHDVGTVSRSISSHSTSPISALSWQASGGWSLDQIVPGRPLNIEPVDWSVGLSERTFPGGMGA